MTKKWTTDVLLSKFHNELEEYCKLMYFNSIEYYKSDKFDRLVGKKYTHYFIFLSKSTFQHIYSFLYFIKDPVLIFPAFNGLRSAIEVIRLIKLLLIDESFRDDYFKNDNLEFGTVRDTKYTQQNVSKILEELEIKERAKDVLTFSHILSNHDLVKGSALSSLHSELSKWSHMLNSNMIDLLSSNGKVYLGLENDLDNELFASTFIKKYLEGLYIILGHYQQLFPFNESLYESGLKLSELYKDYIDKYYKEDLE